jgi:hypothetical protein
MYLNSSIARSPSGFPGDVARNNVPGLQPCVKESRSSRRGLERLPKLVGPQDSNLELPQRSPASIEARPGQFTDSDELSWPVRQPSARGQWRGLDSNQRSVSYEHTEIGHFSTALHRQALTSRKIIEPTTIPSIKRPGQVQVSISPIVYKSVNIEGIVSIARIPLSINSNLRGSRDCPESAAKISCVAAGLAAGVDPGVNVRAFEARF